MTNSQFSQVLKAATRAHAQGCHIIARCTDKATGQAFYAVAGSTGEIYQVVQVSPDSLTCTCKAGQAGRYCKHRALVTLRIKEAAEKAAMDAEQEADRVATEAITGQDVFADDASDPERDAYEEGLADDYEGPSYESVAALYAGGFKDNTRRFLRV